MRAGMKMAGAVAACVVAAAQGACTTSTKLAVPTLVWSPQETWSGQNLYAGLEGVHAQDAVALVERLAGDAEKIVAEESLQSVRLGAAHGNADVTVLFAVEQLSAAELSQALGAFDEAPAAKAAVPALREAFDAAKSSLVMPYVVDKSRPGTQSAWSRWAFGEGSEAVVAVEAAQVATTLESELQGKLSAGGKVRVVVLLPTDLAAWDAAIATTLQVVRSHVEDRFVAVLTGDSAKPAPELPEVNSLIEVSRRRLANILSGHETQVRSSPHIMAGLLLSLILVLVTILYMCCLDDLQTPSFYVKEYPPIGKVYD
ncbi:Hypothetical Protein FCC1311_022912 [Hondaea fermentalgiana]|uniref:Uncharacterized protein n=1 Tax=Hondaea fermentalgiana TaxID=2315210 RepID=A0A2R5GVB5_9STRA|nr:Hypothetical Protein FCC1311_022912 [Hondaea fermentalgiana]|eukprot:GBG34269.1 Hypothetical Protein FCC1311_022912 [Hondaea fermentalgiana]